MIDVRPMTRDAANEVIRRWHSHHKRVHACMWCLGAWADEECVGAVIVGRPVAPALDNGTTLEVVRLCTNGHPNAASFLLGRVVRIVRLMGVIRLVSYTRLDEAGTCYRAAGWRAAAKVLGREHTTGNRAGRWLPGLYEPSTEIVDRARWEIECR